jgi:nucleotide-binding universal stress UspA family protein
VIKPASSEEEIVYEQLGLGADHRQAGLHQAYYYLQGIKERLHHEMGTESDVESGRIPALDITWSVEESTDVAEALLRMAKGEGEGTPTPSDLIVLTTHEHSSLNHWMRGSVAERVLGSTTMPLLLVHPQKHSHLFTSRTSESEQAVSFD